ncbi:MAG: hypothetical protein ACK5DD_11040 [Cyclobacteriaceae bacterium]|jgi:glycerol-3-phosphate O-acyltransferase
MIRDASAITEVVVITEYADSKGPYKIAEKIVLAELIDGRQVDVYRTLRSTLYFWYHALYKLNVVEKLIEEPPIESIIPAREQEGSAALLHIETLTGEDFQMRTIFQKYDYDKKRLEIT